MEISLEQVVGALCKKRILPSFGDDKFMAVMVQDTTRIGDGEYFDALGVDEFAHEDRTYIPVKLPKTLVAAVQREVLNKEEDIRSWHRENRRYTPLVYRIIGWKSYVVDFANSIAPEWNQFENVTPGQVWIASCDRRLVKKIKKLHSTQKYVMARAAAETYAKHHMTFVKARNFYETIQEGRVDVSGMKKPRHITKAFIDYCEREDKEKSMLPQVVRRV